MAKNKKNNTKTKVHKKQRRKRKTEQQAFRCLMLKPPAIQIMISKHPIPQKRDTTADST